MGGLVSLEDLDTGARRTSRIRKRLVPLLLVLVALSVGLYRYMNRPQTIFDEIYQETKKTYRGNNILGGIDGFDIRGSWPSDSEYFKYTPWGTYKEEATPEGYSKIRIGFVFKTSVNIASFSFYKDIGPSVRLRMWNIYSHDDKILRRTIKIVLERGVSDTYIEDETEVRAYLSQYKVTAKDLDTYYDEIVNQKILRDWLSIYDSKYSSDDYGDVRIETAWEDW